jgi:CO/xanthine dehydrogenase Mo-binding subunit
VKSFKYIGKDIPRSDALEKVIGRSLFVTDMKIPDMLYGKILRSPYAHARIKSIDASAAEKMSGVKAVLTKNDIKGKFNNYGIAIIDQTIVATDKVRYVGDPVAAVAAVDVFTAEEALSAIRVEYEELKAVFSIEEALASDAPLIHEKMPSVPALQHLINPIQGSNICNHFKLRHGNVEKGFKESDLIFEDTFTTEPDQHAPLETHCCIASVFPGPRIEVFTNNQDPSNLQVQISQIFDVPQSNIRIIIPYVGGGFGSKIGPKLEPLTVALALKVGKAVKIVLTREEEFLTISRHGSKITIKTGVKKNGTIIAREMAVHFDTGAYADIGPVVIKNIGFSAGGPYRIPNVKIDSFCIYTNKVPAGAMRGFGVPQVAWAYEQQMDVIAEKLGMDSLEFRRMNVLRNGDTFHTGEIIEDIGFDRLLDKVATGIGWGGQKTRDIKQIKSSGKGIAISLKSTATPSTSSAYIKMNSDGSATLMCNTVEMGQGIRTVLKQIISEELGFPFEKIVVLDPDVNVAPFDTGTYSSRSTFHMGNAALLALEDLKKQLLDSASIILNAEVEDLVFAEGFIKVKDHPEKSVPLSQAVRGPGVNRGSVIGKGVYQTKGSMNKETGQGLGSFYWMSASGGVEVEVDRETGEVKVRKYVGIVDVGKAINPANIEQQNIGSIVMALGHTFTERMIYDDKGTVINPNFVDYKIPTVKDLPDEIVVDILEIPHQKGPYGAKGIGEIMIVPPAPAIANALYQATGIRFKDLPITQEKVLSKLLEMGRIVESKIGE